MSEFKKLRTDTASVTVGKEGILSKLEHETLVLPRNETTKVIYDTFDEEFKNYLMKIPPSNCRKICEKLINEKRVFLGRSSRGASKTFLYGMSNVVGDKFISVVLDINDLDIDLKTGETVNIDSCVYVAYMQFIRAVIYTQLRQIRSDTTLNNLVISYLYFAFMNGMSLAGVITPKQDVLLKMAVTYFYSRFCLGMLHPKALEEINKLNSAVYKEFENEFKLFKKYDSLTNIFAALVDLHVIKSASRAMLQMISKFQVAGYYNLTGTYDTVISTAVISIYPVRFLSNLYLNKNLQSRIEKILISYSKKMKYDKLT